MEGSSDFIECLGADVSMKILSSLEDPSDLVRVSAVSSSWRQFLIANGLCKQLCMKMFPDMSSVSRAIDISNTIEPAVFRPGEPTEWARLKREHKVYAFLARGLTSFVRKDCLFEAITASSTDNYPEESIDNTLEPSDRVGQRASYWSSRGESNCAVPETLTYKLMAKMCMVSEIHVQPFQAYFQFGFPIYSAKSVRFLMGHSARGMELLTDMDESSSAQESSHEKYVWTYISPEFSMSQENCLQKFKLPEPVLCVGGILQVQLLGRVQKQEMDGLYYICIAHVEVVGRPLSCGFCVDILDGSGRCTLRHCPQQHLSSCTSISSQGELTSRLRLRRRRRLNRLSASIRGWEQMIFNTFPGPGAVVVDHDDFNFDGNLR